MCWKIRVHPSLLLLFPVLSLTSQTQKVLGPYSSPLVNADTVVRFYYEPSIRDHYIYPLVFRVVADNKDRSQEAFLLKEGDTVSVSPAEMKDLVATMTRSINMPIQTKYKEVLGAYEFLPSTEAMDVVIIHSKGAARGEIAAKDICAKLSVLNSKIKSERAVWEFERFRVQYGCHVPTFNSSKY